MGDEFFRPKDVIKVLQAESAQQAQLGIDALHESKAIDQLVHLQRWLNARGVVAELSSEVEGLIAERKRSELARRLPTPDVHYLTEFTQTGVRCMLSYNYHKPTKTSAGLSINTLDRIVAFTPGSSGEIRVLHQQVVEGIYVTKSFETFSMDQWKIVEQAVVRSAIVQAYNRHPSMYIPSPYFGFGDPTEAK